MILFPNGPPAAVPANSHPESKRLAKPRTYDSPVTRSSRFGLFDDSTPSQDLPIRTSVTDLKRAGSRQLIRRQLSGTFPEVAANLQIDPLDDDNMGIRDCLSKSGPSPVSKQSLTPKASSSTVDSADSKQASAGSERRLDLEQAINLLQALKKTATPDELVALHRALLPTRDLSPSPRGSIIEESPSLTQPPPSRRRSEMPPGLATRVSAQEDLLRKPEDVVAPQKPADGRKGVAIPPPTTTSTERLVPTVNFGEGGRVGTPSELSYAFTGAYRPGTLRITNGAASPEPSIRSRLSLEFEIGSDGGREGASSSAISQSRTARGPPERRDNLEHPVKSCVTSPLPKAQRPQQRRQQPRRASSSQQIQREPIKVEIPESFRASPEKITSAPGGSQQHSPVDFGTPSLPWIHRAINLSQEYLVDCGIASSPYDDAPAAKAESRQTRTSDISDDDGGVDTAPQKGPRRDALSKLNSESADHEGSSYEAASSNRRRPGQLHKADSGYCSDTSKHVLAKSITLDAQSVQTPVNVTKQRLARAHTSDDLFAVQPSSRTLEESRYRSSYMPGLSALPPMADFQNDSLLGTSKPNTATKRSSMPVLTGDQIRSSDVLQTYPALQDSSTAGKKELSGKAPRKLQKPMPQGARRRLELQKLKDQQSESPSPATETRPRLQSSKSEANISQADKASKGIGSSEVFQQSALGGNEDVTPSVISNEGCVPWLSRKRSKSQGRARSRSRSRTRPIVRSGTILDSPIQPDEPLSVKRARSNSLGRPALPSLHPERINFAPGPTYNNSTFERHGDDRRPGPPLHTDFSSLALSLEGSHFSTPPHNPMWGPTYPEALQHKLQLIQQVTPGLSQRRSVPKHRDEAEEPTSANPKVHGHSMSDCSIESRGRPLPMIPKDELAVDEDLPERRGSIGEVSGRRRFSFEATSMPTQPSRSRISYVEDIPPMPEMPVDLVRKASMAEEILSKIFKRSLKQSPSLVDSDQGFPKRGSVQAAVQACNQMDRRSSPQRSEDAATSATRDIKTPPVARYSIDGSIPLPLPQSSPKPVTPSHASQHSGWPGWEQQAKLWRQQRASIAAKLDRPSQGEDGRAVNYASPTARDFTDSRSVVVSRYIAPAGEPAAYPPPPPLHSSPKRIGAYRDQVPDETDNRPAKQDVPRTDSAVSTSTVATVSTGSDGRSSTTRYSPPRSDSSFSVTTTTTTTTWQTRSSAGRRSGCSSSPHGQHPGAAAASGAPPRPPAHRYTRSSSGRFIPYRPSNAAEAERSRARTLAKLNGTGTGGLTPPVVSHSQKSSSESLFDRYSGGLGYGWDRKAGFEGSAGLRTRARTTDLDDDAAADPLLDAAAANPARKLKQEQMGKHFGLDLSDVPVFLRKIS